MTFQDRDRRGPTDAELDTMARALVAANARLRDAGGSEGPAAFGGLLGEAAAIAARFLSASPAVAEPTSAPRCHIPVDLFADLDELPGEGAPRWV